MSDLRRRLARIERDHPPGICTVCGADLRVPPRVIIEFGRPTEDEPTPCVGCGFPARIVVHFFEPPDSIDH